MDGCGLAVQIDRQLANTVVSRPNAMRVAKATRFFQLWTNKRATESVRHFGTQATFQCDLHNRRSAACLATAKVPKPYEPVFERIQLVNEPGSIGKRESSFSFHATRLFPILVSRKTFLTFTDLAEYYRQP